MASYDSYLERVYVNGSTKRDRDKEILSDTLSKNAPNSLSCKDVLINGIEQKVIIDTGTKPYYKTIKSLPHESFSCGDYVEFADTQWLVINADNDGEIYVDGNLQECNYNLKWQNNSGDIVERQCAVMSASQYNSGESATKTITVGYNQLLVYTALDGETLELKNDKRFFIDNAIVNPKVYKLTRIDTVTMSYHGKGCAVLLFTEDQYNPTTDNVELMLCDYKEVEEPVVQTFDITYVGQPQIRCGGSAKTFTANTVSGTYDWSLICTNAQTDYVALVSDGQKCKVKCLSNPLLIGSSFKLRCADNHNVTSELLITIVGGM